MTFAKSARAGAALESVQKLQALLKARLAIPGDSGAFRAVTWLRDGGKYGGGTRQTYEGNFFNRASLNVSQVHYDSDLTKSLGSATAISSIVHPAHPRLPSIHLHISWTEMKSGDGYWRVMADLNPAIVDDADRKRFTAALTEAGGPDADYGMEQGDRYFSIPALKRRRGVAHFYLEQFRTSDELADKQLAENFGQTMIETYADILLAKLPQLTPPTEQERAEQLAYHTVYLFQVLTLDRGTTSGLLVHDQNDLGILGSLPARVDPRLLAQWESLVPRPQNELVRALCAAIPDDGRVEDAQKIEFCRIVRQHYGRHPDALNLQARGDIVPPTVRNHFGRD